MDVTGGSGIAAFDVKDAMAPVKLCEVDSTQSSFTSVHRVFSQISSFTFVATASSTAAGTCPTAYALKPKFSETSTSPVAIRIAFSELLAMVVGTDVRH